MASDKQIDRDFSQDGQEALLIEKNPWVGVLLATIILLIGVAIWWADYAVLDEVTVGVGKIVPSKNIQVIQHLEGGILAKKKVNLGEKVQKGQVLFVLDNTRFSSEYEKELAQNHGLKAANERLKNLVDGGDKIALPNEHQSFYQQEQEYLDQQRLALQDELLTQKKSLDLIKKELAILTPLLKQGLVTKVDVLRVQREENKIQGKLIEIIDEFREKAKKELVDKSGELAESTIILKNLKDKLNRTKIVSPMSGVINKIEHSTLGAVIGPGEKIAEVVPEEDGLSMEAHIAPGDIAYIKSGQKATLKINAYDYSIYGGMEAKITHISPHTLVDEQGESYYLVKLTSKQNGIDYNGRHLPVKSGMTLTAHILTGQKTVLDYVLKPLLKTVNSALQEK